MWCKTNRQDLAFAGNSYGSGNGVVQQMPVPGLTPMMANFSPAGTSGLAMDESRFLAKGESGRRGPSAPMTPVIRVRQEFPEAWIWTEALAR